MRFNRKLEIMVVYGIIALYLSILTFAFLLWGVLGFYIAFSLISLVEVYCAVYLFKSR